MIVGCSLTGGGNLAHRGKSKHAIKASMSIPRALAQCSERRLVWKLWKESEAYYGDEFRRGEGLHRRQSWLLDCNHQTTRRGHSKN